MVIRLLHVILEGLNAPVSCNAPTFRVVTFAFVATRFEIFAVRVTFARVAWTFVVVTELLTKRFARLRGVATVRVPPIFTVVRLEVPVLARVVIFAVVRLEMPGLDRLVRTDTFCACMLLSAVTACAVTPTVAVIAPTFRVVKFDVPDATIFVVLTEFDTTRLLNV